MKPAADIIESNRPHATAPGATHAAARLPLSQWPPGERPQERLMRLGTAPLSDAELLAVFLRTGMRGKDALTLARELIAHFGSLQALLASDCAQFSTIAGLGPVKWAQLTAAIELTRRSLGEHLQRADALSSPGAVGDYLRLWLRDRPYECFACLYLDARHRLIEAREMFRGTLTQTAVYPREIARQALQLNAAAVILSHNHPSGIAQASVADRALTDAVRAALAQLDVAVLDHLIVAGNCCLSFAERGWLQ